MSELKKNIKFGVNVFIGLCVIVLGLIIISGMVFLLLKVLF